MTHLPPVRWLSSADVTSAMPDIDERLRLAELTMTALVADADLPAKIAVHPRATGSFGHAMPAFLRGEDDGADRLGLKWVTGFAGNSERGLPAINAVVVLNDPATGLPVALLDGGPITAARTPAVSGVALRRWGPRSPRARVAILGAGVQAGGHVPVVGRVMPGARLTLFDRHGARAEALAGMARATEGIASVQVAASARDAVAAADVIITAASFGPPDQLMPPEWLAPSATVVAVDYATYASAEVARDASLFLVDERGQFEANRAAGAFRDYPTASMTIGEAILRDVERPAGRVLVSHLGVGLADVVFGAAILERAETLGLGIVLPR
ncbi:MAG TPA: hypothetical protein VEY67_04755 [Candidatus Dormibacteraeota bacterium]|nr:hypothetical protein [Candidatus Dormibacteraeota bacterium]